MKEIPNKIFIDEDLIAYHCLTDKHEGDLEYIRKDALLDWAKEHYDRLKFLYNVTPASVVGGKMDAYKELIDKIESL
ncbi:hypothetical protein [Selenomonas ruminantium]|uniref:hypothetical protein n=1 Tax=Selenomonas ruminantium TaxID=971 RepID=UPI0026ECE392|nr:hypothetical protein [Selenomonas ruminantium]